MTKHDKAKNITQVAKGKVEEKTGQRLGNEEMERKGKLDQVKGNLKQAGEKVKDAFKH